MSAWGAALLAAGSAVAGGAVTGWYARGAGVAQAEAARHAGDRQADALLDTVRMTLREQAAVRVLDLRRQTYVRFLDAAEAALAAARTGAGAGSGAGSAGDPTALHRALAGVTLEGPDEVAEAARAVTGGLRRHASPDDLERAKAGFVAAARAALSAPPPPEPRPAGE